uniref:ubiquitinyl hydrolase 1 n=1 Tax=Monodon monoceros TaxID=40151 RepID=A0A8C6B9V9_MONMO
MAQQENAVQNSGRNCSGSRICLLREKRTWCPRARSTVEAFHNISMNLIEHVKKWTSVADLLASFKNQSNSDYLVVYLGLLTSHFMESGKTVKEFCHQEVEAMCKENDHIHIITLTQALSVFIQVEYMSCSDYSTTDTHTSSSRAQDLRSNFSTDLDTMISSIKRVGSSLLLQCLLCPLPGA